MDYSMDYRLLGPSLYPRVCSNSCSLSQWCYLSYPLLPPSPFAFNLSQCQSLLQWVSSSHEVAKVLEFQLQHQPFQWIFRVDFFFRNIYVYIYIIYLCIYVFQVESEKFAWLVGFTLRKRALYVEKLLHVQPVTFFPLCFVCCKCDQNSEMWFSFEGPEAKPIIMFSFCSVI